MPQILETVDWFLNTSPDYQAKEPTKRDQLLALVQREIAACQVDAELEQLEARKSQLEQLYSPQLTRIVSMKKPLSRGFFMGLSHLF